MNVNNPLWLIIIASIIAILPIVVGVLTSYIKINVVLSMLKSGIGAQQVPGALTVMALSFAMTAFIMGPVIEDTAKIISEKKMPQFSQMPNKQDFAYINELLIPWREFMKNHAGERELDVLSEIADRSTSEVSASMLEKKGDASLPSTNGQDSMRILIPAFVLTELKEGFAMGFVLLLPFLAIDLIVGNILAGMGMHMLSPTMISLPLKLILFVLADGWILLTKGLVNSYV